MSVEQVVALLIIVGLIAYFADALYRDIRREREPAA